MRDFPQCSKIQIIDIKNLNIKTCFIQFLWFFRLKCWFKCQMISRIHLSLSNAYKLMCFDRNMNGNRDVKFFEFNYWSLHCTLKSLLMSGYIKVNFWEKMRTAGDPVKKCMYVHFTWLYEYSMSTTQYSYHRKLTS